MLRKSAAVLTMSAAAIMMLIQVTPVGGQNGSPATIVGCVNNNSGEIKLLKANEACKPNEIQVQWNAAGMAGPSGATGATGPAGVSGPSGPIGPSGPAGASGTAGPSGPAGATGPAGVSGPSGATGATGPAGVSGPSGPIGPSGPAGASGPSGPSGPAGVSGPSGATGATGPAGVSGPSGPVGPSGPAGASGTAGPSGPSGPAGPAGLLGYEQIRTQAGFGRPLPALPNTNVVIRAQCPVGKRLIGGGYAVEDLVSLDLIKADGPAFNDPERAYELAFFNNSIMNLKVTVTAICAFAP